MKLILTSFLLFMTLGLGAQSFYLPSPEGWETETFAVPMDFAPEIKYKGEEHIRFTPGWGDVKSDEHWSYIFLWWLEPNSEFTAETLTRDLKAYYSGLIRANLVETKVKAASSIETETAFKKVKTQSGDAHTYEGSVKMYNYMTDNPIILNVDVHVLSCPPQQNTAVLFLISPQQRDHSVWSKVNSIVKNFRCQK